MITYVEGLKNFWFKKKKKKKFFNGKLNPFGIFPNSGSVLR
ncbi:MAG: hypothetical protein CM15mP32_3480 [Flavobacteriaceae bacterium]|nr:MAG: hypothetical protein CM15mP32_3480 [Flavobacteriaceae bacterium]